MAVSNGPPELISANRSGPVVANSVGRLNDRPGRLWPQPRRLCAPTSGPASAWRLVGLEPSSELRALEERIVQGDRSPLAQTRSEPAHNLPASLTTFIGRDALQAAVEASIEQGRLVTLVGIGGSGKSRLSVEVAARRLSGFPGGVWLVELAPVTQMAQMVRAIAEVLGVPANGASISLTCQRRPLHRDHPPCSLLDDCEHIAGLRRRGEPLSRHSSPLASWPPAVSRCRFLPKLSGPCAALDMRPTPCGFVPGPLPTSPARSPRFDHDGETVAEICRHLDGLPLAIELAAAQVQALIRAGLAAPAGDRFSAPCNDPPPSPTAIESAGHDRLEPRSALSGISDLFRRLAVFVGPLT